MEGLAAAGKYGTGTVAVSGRFLARRERVAERAAVGRRGSVPTAAG